MNELRILSFNIRYDEPSDGVNRWQLRCPVAVRLIRQCRPDVIGLQEPEAAQLLDLESALTEYGRVGVSRYGNDFEKFTAILYRRESVTVESTGVFWFSKTPDVAASMDWLIHKPYAVNHARFRHRGGYDFELFNTHFPYKPEQEEARMQAARLLTERAGGAEPVIVTGDFNSRAGGAVHQLLMSVFRDAWIEAAERHGPGGTLHRFTGQPFPNSRIDWILYRAPWTASRAETVTYHEDGRYPSDHFPVLATFHR